MMPDKLYLGVDFGTTGIRAIVLDISENTISDSSVALPKPERLNGRPQQDPELWWAGFSTILGNISENLSSQKRSIRDIDVIAIDGTSGTMLLCDEFLRPVTPGLMYNSGNFREQAYQISLTAPENSITLGDNSALARLLYLQTLDTDTRAKFCMHQADWIAGRLMGHGGNSDDNNCLKLGFDLETNSWPDWFASCGVRMELLPVVHRVGHDIGAINPVLSNEIGLSRKLRICAGTTDSNAAFLASGAKNIGEGVTSLGTTLAIKLISAKAIQSIKHGVYSHRIGNTWLAGGASNSGGGVLLKYFSRDQIEKLSIGIDANIDTGLNYYPLPETGERFPINDPNYQSRVAPRPKDDQRFLQALLEGVAQIEAQGYSLLEQLGAAKVTRIYSSGGGAHNQSWSQIRERYSGVPVTDSVNINPAYGSALLAKGSFTGLFLGE